MLDLNKKGDQLGGAVSDNDILRLGSAVCSDASAQRSVCLLYTSRLILIYHTRTEPVAVRIFQHNAILRRIRLKIGGSVHKRHALRHFHLLMPDDGAGDLTVGAADSVCEQKRRQTVCQFFIQYTRNISARWSSLQWHRLRRGTSTIIWR